MNDLQAKSSEEDQDTNVEQMRYAQSEAEEDTYYSGPTVNSIVSSCLMSCKNFQRPFIEPPRLVKHLHDISVMILNCECDNGDLWHSKSQLQVRSISCLLTIVRRYLEHSVSQVDLPFIR
jgi:hypothetical protein